MESIKEIIEHIRPELRKAVDFFIKEVGRIRTGNASPILVEDVQVELFGKPMPLKQLAAISCPDSRQIIIQPWEKGYLQAIEQALMAANLGTSPIVDQDLIRIHLPPLTQEFRLMLSKTLFQKEEQARQTMRRWRDEAWGRIQEKTREGQIREDDKFRGKDELQKVIDEYTKKIEEMTARKKKEIES